ncbi:hypothetical protein Hte_007766 [Hypoxylon texense]
MGSIYGLDDMAELRRLQSTARHNLQVAPDPRALTPPRLLRQFLQSQLDELNNTGCSCENHEMILVGSQSFSQNHLRFVSAVCRNCRYHFHIKGDFQHSREYTADDHRHHMLIPCGQKSPDSLKAEQVGFNDTIGYARFICAIDDCFFNIEISVLPCRIEQEVINKFGDKNRMKRNLDLARAQDPERYEDFHDAQGLAVDGMLRKYLTDALNHTGARPLRINKRNKKFLVAFGSDFDPLLISIGFFEGEDAESGEPCWYISVPEEQKEPTPVRTLRARMEEALAELSILTRGATTHAWDDLLKAFQGEYHNTGMEFTSIAAMSEADTALLGCLSNYLPNYFSWAAITLAKLRLKDRDKYLDAGLRCIGDRNDDASTEIVVYKSQFDGTPSMDARVQAAFTFFGADPADVLTAGWFLERYYELVKCEGTDEVKAQAQQHLEAIGNYLGQDIVSEIDPRMAGNVGETGLMSSSPNGSGRRMSYSSAARILKVEPNYTPELIRDIVGHLVQEEKEDRSKIIEAIDVLSELKRQQDKPEAAAELQQIAEFIKATGDMPMLISQPPSSPKATAFVDTPPGLRNIGNTCYLNSLLQYFYNVKVIRDLVLDFDQVKLDLDDATLAQRRTGGNGTSVNLEEAIVARQFVEMLQGLFSDLQKTTEIAAQPSQKLANTALSSARDILEQPQSQPPPLPARPSPAPPVPPKEDSGAASDAVNVTVQSVNDKLETASSRSSQTLVDDNEDVPMSYIKLDQPVDTVSIVTPPATPPIDDVHMQDADESQPLDEKFAQVSRRLEQSDRSGTSQQDVEEIIGNILEHFMRAIRPDGPMAEKPDLQADKITKTFFTTIVNYTVKTKKGYPNDYPYLIVDHPPLNVEVVPERWITAYPEEASMASDGINPGVNGTSNRPCTLIQALDRYFKYEIIDDGNRARYSCIKTVPPILHICIQRSTPKGKNKNPVLIPESLYLDRYLEAAKGSPLWLARKRVWAINSRIAELDDLSRQVSKPVESTVQNSSVPWLKTYDNCYGDFKNLDTASLAPIVLEALAETVEDKELRHTILEDTRVRHKHKASDPLESETFKRVAVAVPGSVGAVPVSDRLSDALSDAPSGAPGDRLSEALRGYQQSLQEATREEVEALRQKEQDAFENMEKKYSIHAVICHRGGTAAGHYWVWIRDFKRNVWYRYNDETVTEDSRGTDAVLSDLNETGDPYYVAYVRDEMKDQLVDVPQRHRLDAENTPTAGEDVEMIEGVALDPIG